MATRLQTAWHREVSHALGIPRLDTTESLNGRLTLHLPCTTCPRMTEFITARRLPPDQLVKKLRQKNWDTKPGRIRCPSCKMQDRRTPIYREKELSPPPPPTLEQQIVAAFTKKEEVPVDARIGVDKTNIRITIPKDSSIFNLFVGEDNKSRSYWKMTVISPGIGLEPQIMLDRLDEKPKGQLKGVTKGNLTNGIFQLQISVNVLPKAIKDIGMFSTSESKIVRHTDDLVVLALPEEKKVSGKFRSTPPVNEEAQRAALAPPPPLAEAPPQEPIAEKPKHETITLEQAISAINRFKEKTAGLSLKVTEDGFLGAELTVVKQIGRV